MAECIVVYPPNKPFERFRQPPEQPVLHDHSFFLEINGKGEVLLGSSDVCGPYWEGTLFYYKGVEDALLHKYSQYYISLATTTDVKFMHNSSCIVLAEDSCQLKILKTSTSTRGDIKCEDVFYSDGRIQQIATWNNDYKVLTCSNRSISIWDVKHNQSGYPVQTYDDYHTEQVLSIDTFKSSENVFASVARDRRACLWDDRLEMPVQVLYENEFTSLNAVSCSKHTSETIAVGSDGGDVYLLDIRYPKEFTSSYHCFDSGVHRVVFSKDGHLAVCGKTSDVEILDCREGISLVCKQSCHNGITRGLSWSGSAVYSCGYDKQLVKHDL